jgi:CRP/FNR family cyclic AMP-dependent transcriptional regulator
MTMLQALSPTSSAFTSPMPLDEASRIRATLARAPIFQGLGHQAIDELAERMSLRRTLGGHAIIAANDSVDALYVIMGGRVKLVQFGDSGREVTLAVLRPGDFFGEVAMFGEPTRGTAAIAIDPCTVLVLPRHELMRHLGEHPQTGIKMITELSRRLRRADDTIAELALCDVNARLIRKLVVLAREEGQESGAEGLTLRRRPTQQDLANMVGSCRETVSRTYNQLARQGLIIPRGRGLVLTPRLLAMVEPARAA